MALFGHKRSRSTAAASLRRSSSMIGRALERLKDRSVLFRLALCGMAIAAMVFAVEGWKPAFPYRKGMRPDHGIVAEIEFHRINQFETARARSDAEQQVPFTFIHNPEPFSGLPIKLRSALGSVAEAKTVDDLPPDVRRAFGLVAPDTTTSPSRMPPAAETFPLLKEALPGDQAAQKIDSLTTEFETFLSPLRETGIADPQEFSANNIGPDHRVRIVNPTTGHNRIVSSLEVQLPEVLKESGQIGKSWLSYPGLMKIRVPLEHWLLTQTPATLEFDSPATQEEKRLAAENVQPRTELFARGDTLVPPGQAINDEMLSLLQTEFAEMDRHVTFSQRMLRVMTVTGLLIVLAALNGYYLWADEPRILKSASRLSVYLILVVATVLIGRVLSFDPWRAEIIPLMTTAMVLAIVYSPGLGALTAFTLALILSVSTLGDLSQFVVMMAVTATAVMPLKNVDSRSTLIKVGFAAGVVYFLVSWGSGILQSQSFEQLWTDTNLLTESLRGAAWCLVAGYLVAGSLPFIESAFGAVTDISLLEMSDVSHPLLQELVRRAPGTYNHSIAVATIGETAADSIGANGLLVRVGAYYHDIGKMLKPQYFIENMQAGAASRHEHLAPAMSTLIIIGHVKDGVDLAHQHNLPQPLIDFIEQHHGTTLVQYFYNEATRIAEGRGDQRSEVEESSFRYPGPKPQTREAGVLMLADAVESTSRTLSEPTPKRIETLVHDITMKRLLDGQFDECSLTLSEIHAIEESLTKSLIGIYHGRIKYPEQRSA